MKAQELSFPEKYDGKEIMEWVGDSEILDEFKNDFNYCLFVKFQWGDKRNPEFSYQFLRFFTIGDDTVCSVDFDSNQNSWQAVLPDLLNQKYGRHNF